MNLWADYDNQHMPAEEAVRHKQRGRLTEQIILSALRSWLLAEYVPSYSHALAAMRFYRRCYWIDAWGMHTRADITIPPSVGPSLKERVKGDVKGRKKEVAQVLPPVLQPVAALSAQLAQENRSLTLYGIVLEAGSSTRKDGKARQNGNVGDGETAQLALIRSELTLPKESGVLHASWLEVGPMLLKEIDQPPAIFLLNPFGATIFRYDNLAPLYQRTAPTELCLLIPHKQVEAQLLASIRSPAISATLTALLRTDRWKTLLPKDEEVGNRVNTFIDLLLASMQRQFLSVQRIEVSVQTGPALIETAPYTLLFATRSKDSLLCMNDAVCIRRRDLLARSYRGILGEDWFAAQQQTRDAEELQQLRQRVLQLGRVHRTRRWPELRQQLLIATFGQFTVRNYDEIIVGLIREGTVHCEWKRKPTGNTGEEASMADVPGNDDTMLWN
ncbi:MAG: hypothetical protein ACR2H5_18205 [Ktedonobacteraceae bacterium]